MIPVRVFLDTDVVTAFLADVSGNADALAVMRVGRDRCYELCISSSTASDMLRYASRCYPSLLMSDVSALFTILPMNREQWDTAMKMTTDNADEAFQVACAVAGRCSMIVSFGRKFTMSPLPVYTPEEFLKLVVV